MSCEESSHDDRMSCGEEDEECTSSELTQLDLQMPQILDNAPKTTGCDTSYYKYFTFLFFLHRKAFYRYMYIQQGYIYVFVYANSQCS